MAEPLTTAAIAAKILDSLLGGAISKALDGALTTASQALRDAHQELEKEQAQRAMHLALIIQQAAEEIEPELEQLQQASGQDPRSLFQHPPFLAQIARALLDNATLDVDAVRREYQTLFNDGRWDQLHDPLEMFFGKIKLLLQRDAVWGPALRAYRAEAQRADIHADLGQLIAAAWAGVEALHTLPETLAQPEQARLSAVQRAYLCGLYAECNDLPLAGDDTPDAPRGRAAPRLQRVYVDLDAKQSLTLARVLTRLQVAPADQAAVRAALAELGPQELRGQGRRQAELSEEWIGSLQQAAAPTSSDDDQKQVWQRLAQWGVTQDSLAAALQPVTAFEALRDQRHCVLLGDPGSGKSTLTRRIAGLLAAEAHDNLPTEDRDWRGALAPLFDHWCMPIRIVLSEWAQTLPAGHKGVADDLIAACQQVVGQANNLGQDTLRAWLTDQLTAQSGALVLLLDGLDEVTDAAQRGTVRAAINHFCQRYPHVAVIVTCRELPYQDPDFRLELPACTLATLSERSVADFLQRWHAELHAAGIYGQQEARQARQRLQEAINDPNRSDLRELAGAPLQLTLMARVNYRHGLPGSRAMLYETYVNEWLHEWERKRQADKGAATELERLLTSAGLALTDLNRVLNELAFKVHGQSGSRDTVTIDRHALQDALEGLYLSKHPQQRTEATKWAADVLHFIDKRSGLLRARQEGKLYTFAHRTFQEYLAARWIASADTATRLKAKIDDSNWAEVVLLTFGHQIFKQEQPDAALLTLKALLPDQISSEAKRSRAILLGEVYVSLLEPHRVRTSAYQEEAQQVMQAMPERLQQAMQAGLLDAPDVAAPALARRRLEAGLLLAALEPAEPRPDDTVSIPGVGEIGRYPVTNREYGRFIAAGGYQQHQPWWTDEGKQEIMRWRSHWPDEPGYWQNPRFNQPIQPVVGVSWYEAKAYCEWLTRQLQAEGRAVQARLPTLAEWQQAAGNGPYPWDPSFHPTCANSEESALNQTTPVTMYPQGCTPQGVWDMAGNVWEWTGDNDGDQSNPWYYLAGGSWFNSAEHIGSAARLRHNPRLRHDDVGFRILVVPVSR